MNHLQHETSPYLLQHAHNPVEWYAWRPEAFERARRENKPIVLSIGYSTCHWCHVMERESFEDLDTADFMNEHFINIKVDREERPDLDQIYMDACQAIHGNGGWPLNCFLLPDGKPFYAGTYYPPRPAHNRPSWLQLLRNMYQAYHQQYNEVVTQAERLVGSVQSGNTVFWKERLMDLPDQEVFQKALPTTLFEAYEARADRAYGGFGGAPKFPQAMSLRYLLDYALLTGTPEAQSHLHYTLQKMIGGGIYDQLGGGFARYTVDQAWLVPHFEKMLYDNALLVGLLADAYRTQPIAMYAATIRETLDFVQREMTSIDGSFYSALDADSEGEEGKFYVWSWREVLDLLGPDEAPLFAQVYGVSEEGNWEGHNILWRARSLAEVAQENGIAEAALAEQLARNRATMLEYRSHRIRPGLDDKQILSWNALMITAYCKAYHALAEPAYLETALRAYHFVQQKMYAPEGRLWHTYKNGTSQYSAYLDDYANWIAALLDLHELTSDLSFVDQATTFTQLVLDQFLDPKDNLCYFTAADQTDVPLRLKEVYDNATPSGNATMLRNLQRLAALTDKTEWNEQVRLMLKPMTESIGKYPNAFGRWSIGLLHWLLPQKEIAIVGNEALSYAASLHRVYYPNTIIIAHQDGNVPAYPLLADRTKQEHTLIYVCENFECQLPVKSLTEATRLLKKQHL